MYPAALTLLLLVFPVTCIAMDALVFNAGASSFMDLVGKWFTFWAAGVRLFLAGFLQVTRPRFTANTIFGIKGASANPVVREVGFGNLSLGTLGVLSLAMSSWVIPAALAGGLYYGLAAIGHMARGHRNAHGQLALMTDLFAVAMLGTFVSLKMF